jgi:hypothetical protein
MTIRRRRTRLPVSIGVIIAAMGLTWLMSGGAFAGDDPPLRFQGLLMDRHGQTLIINERPLLLTKETRVLMGNKAPVSDMLLVPPHWVVVVAGPATAAGQPIKTIYLFPRKLNGAEMVALFSDASESR